MVLFMYESFYTDWSVLDVKGSEDDCRKLASDFANWDGYKYRDPFENGIKFTILESSETDFYEDEESRTPSERFNVDVDIFLGDLYEDAV